MDDKSKEKRNSFKRTRAYITLLRLALAAKVHVPACYRLHPSRPQSVEYLSIQLTERIEKMSWPKKRWMIGENSRGFFLPAPFKPDMCVNVRTTLWEDTAILGKEFVSVPKLRSRKICQDVFHNRRAVASWHRDDLGYTLYSLQELQLCWNSAQTFEKPCHPHERWSDFDVQTLVTLLQEEFDDSVAAPLLQTISGILAVPERINQISEHQLRVIQTFSMDDERHLLEFFIWLFTTGLVMRGWKGDRSQSSGRYPLTKGSCHPDVDDLPDARIQHCLLSLSAIAKRMSDSCWSLFSNISMRVYLPEVESETETMSSTFSRAEQKKSDHATLTHAHARASLRDDTWDGVPVMLQQIEDDTPFVRMTIMEGPNLREQLDAVGRSETCYREISRSLIQTAGFYLKLFWKFEVPQCPLFSLEEIK